MKEFIVKSNDKVYNVKANDAEHAAKLIKLICKDGRRLNYDDDIIRVTLNGKEVYKGIAEDWVDDNFDNNFKWTGSQYEASNSQGKWVVKVIDSIKDEASQLDVIQALVTDEQAAIAAYANAIKNLDGNVDPQYIAVLRNILKEENKHVENLQAIITGNVTEKNLEDSIKDSFERRDFGDVRVIERSGQIEIGWPALGTVSISNAERFLRDLQNAINYAKRF